VVTPAPSARAVPVIVKSAIAVTPAAMILRIALSLAGQPRGAIARRYG
jgi:hypothetical protein